MNIEKVQVYGFEPAFYGMRNPHENWDKSDSIFDYPYKINQAPWPHWYTVREWPLIGPEDLRLACNLITAGRPSHRKFIRQICIWANVRVSRGQWQELDTYKVGATRMSCSTMFKLGSRPLDRSDFADGDVDTYTLNRLNRLGERFRAAKGPEKTELLIKLKRRLPEGFLQTATYHFNYEVALAIYADRRDHRMPEWSDPDGLCAFIRSLPYMDTFITALEAKYNKETI